MNPNKKRAVTVLTAIMTVLLLSSCSIPDIGSLFKTSPSPTSQSYTISTTPYETTIKLGENISVVNAAASWEFTVNSIEIAEDYKGMYEPLNGLYLIVNITLINRGEFLVPFVPEPEYYDKDVDMKPTVKFGNRISTSPVILDTRLNIAKYGFNKDNTPLTGYLVFDISQKQLDDTESPPLLSFFIGYSEFTIDIKSNISDRTYGKRAVFPENSQYDLEAWALGCSAILAALNDGDLYQFGMREKNTENAEDEKTTLSGSWGCYSREDLIETIYSMTDDGHSTDFDEAYDLLSSLSDAEYQELLTETYRSEAYMWELTKALGDKWGDKKIKAWDWFRMIHLAGWGYVAGYLELEEACSLMEPVIERLRGTFSSWDEATENYMDGYAWWSLTDVSEPDTDYQQRLKVYEMLKKRTGDKNLFDPSVWE